MFESIFIKKIKELQKIIKNLEDTETAIWNANKEENVHYIISVAQERVKLANKLKSLSHKFNYWNKKFDKDSLFDYFFQRHMNELERKPLSTTDDYASHSSLKFLSSLLNKQLEDFSDSLKLVDQVKRENILNHGKDAQEDQSITATTLKLKEINDEINHITREFLTTANDIENKINTILMNIKGTVFKKIIEYIEEDKLLKCPTCCGPTGRESPLNSLYYTLVLAIENNNINFKTPESTLIHSLLDVSDCPELIEVLINAGVDLTKMTDFRGLTPLHLMFKNHAYGSLLKVYELKKNNINWNIVTTFQQYGQPVVEINPLQLMLNHRQIYRTNLDGEYAINKQKWEKILEKSKKEENRIIILDFK